MCEVIQLLYANECTRDQYPFNGQMRTGTGPAQGSILLFSRSKLISLHFLNPLQACVADLQH